MAFGLPNFSFIGYPVAMLCAGHAGLGFREARPADNEAIAAHYKGLSVEDRRMRFCATLTDDAIDRHVANVTESRALVLVALDGPLWSSPLYDAGSVRAVAELSVFEKDAELGLSVDPQLRRRGVGTYLVETAARLLEQRGVERITAYTMRGNKSFLTLARKLDAAIEMDADEVEARFPTSALRSKYLSRRVTEQVFRGVNQLRQQARFAVQQ